MSGIEWTGSTWNPISGCDQISPGCQHCYAEAFAKRTGNQVWGKGADRRRFAPAHWAEPLKWDRAAEATDTATARALLEEAAHLRREASKAEPGQ